MELAAWFLTFATAAALLYAVTRALAVALRIAIAVLVVAAVAVGIQAYGRGERGEGLWNRFVASLHTVEGAAKSAWDTAKPYLDTSEKPAPKPKPH